MSLKKKTNHPAQCIAFSGWFRFFSSLNPLILPCFTTMPCSSCCTWLGFSWRGSHALYAASSSLLLCFWCVTTVWETASFGDVQTKRVQTLCAVMLDCRKNRSLQTFIYIGNADVFHMGYVKKLFIVIFLHKISLWCIFNFIKYQISNMQCFGRAFCVHFKVLE